MRIVKPYAKLLSDLSGSLRTIEAAARVSHRSEDLGGTNTKRFIQAVVRDHGDWSVVEHVTCSVEFLVDRGITHELVRHRLFSYTQESTRFVNYAKKMPPSFVYPRPEVECSRCAAGESPELSTSVDAPWTHNGTVICPYDTSWLAAVKTAEITYRHLLENGWRPQEARSVFPNALAAKLIMTGNLRSWRHFLRMRTTSESHPQMRQVTIPLLEEFKAAVPLLYNDIQAGARQVDNLRLPA